MKMQIQSTQRLRPFSHLYGTSCILLKSNYQIEIFPSLLRVKDWESTSCFEVKFSVSGPFQNFTAQLDLESSKVLVWFQTESGLFRYSIEALAEKEGFALFIDRLPQSDVFVSLKEEGALTIKKEQGKPLQNKEMVIFEGKEKKVESFPFEKERLSLGCHKAQDWEMIKRRKRLDEILPVWLQLGHQLPSQESPSSIEGTYYFLEELKGLLKEKKNDLLGKKFLQAFECSFSSLLLPHVQDCFHLGYDLPKVSGAVHPLHLLLKGAEYIKSLFVGVYGERVEILPQLPPELVYGRYQNISFEQGRLDLEWTKKQIRKMAFYAEKDGELSFKFFHQVRSYRLRHTRKDRGALLNNGETIECRAGKLYFFDNFKS